jgi:uncharacterized protein (TIGR03435 family)
MAVSSSFFRIAIVFMVAARIPGQNRTTAEPQFEVASVKASEVGSRGPTIYSPTRARFAITSITTKSLIAYAYDVRDFQVSGGPNWISSDEYDIVAKPQGEATNERILAMTRGLLADRFSLKVHRESKEMSVLALTLAQGGPKLHPSVGVSGPEVRGGRGHLIARNVSMGLLAAQLAGRVLDRPVLDRTGVAGEFDVNLEWTPDENQDLGPSVFTALQEQLGLKLESQRGVVDVLVIDHVERPSAN